MASAFDAVETVRSVLSILEQQLVVVELIEDVLDSGLSVAIGAEHGFEPLASCALVVAPVEVNGEELGTIGVLGPTRMNYPRALAAVRLVGEELAERFGPAPVRRSRGESAVVADYYELLGVGHDASEEEMKRAYRQRARELHPDSTGGDPEAERRSKRRLSLTRCCRDPERRRRYDMFGPDGVDAGDPEHGRRLRWGSRRPARSLLRRGARPQRPSGTRPGAGCRDGARRSASTRPSFGASKEMTVDTLISCCDVRGERREAGHHRYALRRLWRGGGGRRVRQSILGQVVTAFPCNRCGGVGEVDREPVSRLPRRRAAVGGRRPSLSTCPAGVDHGSTLRLSGPRSAGPTRRPSGRPLRAPRRDAGREVRAPG